MTDTVTAKDQADHFWARVRTALMGARPTNHERQPAYGQAAMARSLGMKPKLGNLIEEQLSYGWQAAAERNVSLCLLVLEMDRFPEYFTAYGRDTADDCLHWLEQAIAETLPRDTDLCLRMDRATFVVVMPDLPVLMARAITGQINKAVHKLSLAHKESHAGMVTVSMGLAVVNPEGSYDRRFFEAGAEALKKAQRKGLGRVQSVDLRPAQEKKRRKAA